MRSGWTSYGERRFYFTYILSNTSMTLYIGIPNNLARRVTQHKNGTGSAFTSRYHFDRLVYFEQTTYARACRSVPAIAGVALSRESADCPVDLRVDKPPFTCRVSVSRIAPETR